MKFRIVYIGNTGCLKELESVAKAINPTARKSWLGIVCQDDCIEATVETVEEGKLLMKQIYKKINCFPKYYSYVDGDSFWNSKFTEYLGTTVHSDRYDYAEPVTEEHFEDFLED